MTFHGLQHLISGTYNRNRAVVRFWVLATQECQVFRNKRILHVSGCLESIASTLFGVSSTATLCWELRTSNSTNVLLHKVQFNWRIYHLSKKKATEQFLSNSNYYKRNDRKWLHENTLKFWQFYVGTARVLVFNNSTTDQGPRCEVYHIQEKKFKKLQEKSLRKLTIWFTVRTHTL